MFPPSQEPDSLRSEESSPRVLRAPYFTNTHLLSRLLTTIKFLRVPVTSDGLQVAIVLTSRSKLSIEVSGLGTSVSDQQR